jgi:hypothetical protein
MRAHGRVSRGPRRMGFVVWLRQGEQTAPDQKFPHWQIKIQDIEI